MNFEEVVVYSMSICIVGDFYTIVVVVKVCMLIVNNCKSYVISYSDGNDNHKRVLMVMMMMLMMMIITIIIIIIISRLS